MFRREDPYIISYFEQMSYEDVGKQSVSTMAKPLLEINDAGKGTVDLEASDSEKYISKRLVNIIKSYDENGVQTTVRKYYPIERCTEENFKSTEFEKLYWDQVKDSSHQYCIDQNTEVYMQGTRDSAVLLQEHAYIIYEIKKCEASDVDDPDWFKPADTVCVDDSEKATWLDSKRAMFKIIN